MQPRANLGAAMEETDLLSWIDAEVRNITKKYGTPRLHESQDLISEGWIVAQKALRDYNENRNASLKTFVQACVKNRIIDIFRYENRRVHDGLEKAANKTATTYFAYVDVSMTLKHFLKEDFEKLEDVINDVEYKARRKKQGTLCFARISQSLNAYELSQAV